ncbi:hypothetical protein [Leptothermofonsia sp. ETS-13]|uniref:hypothetical protein n=1 Tax=Leptothermofonsia sp. ETS-13 TaxID=3035696 RepID=UPI003B9F6974
MDWMIKIGLAIKKIQLRFSSLTGLVVLVAAPALAQSANFGTLTLSPEKAVGVVSGTTGGSTSLPAIVSNSDRHNNSCLGFGDPTP